MSQKINLQRLEDSYTTINPNEKIQFGKHTLLKNTLWKLHFKKIETASCWSFLGVQKCPIWEVAQEKMHEKGFLPKDLWIW